MENLEKLIFGLLPLIPDIRDFSHHTVFGTAKIANIPIIDFDISPLPPIILNQIDTDFCTAYGSSGLNTYVQVSDYSLINYLKSKDMDSSLTARSVLSLKYKATDSKTKYLILAQDANNGKENLIILAGLMKDNGDYFDPLYQMSKIKQVRGEYTGYGANLRDACQALTKYGSLPKKQSPFTYKEGKPSDQVRDFLANWLNWPTKLDTIASKWRLGSFFTVDGPYDPFDNVRSLLWANYGQKLPIGVLFGLNWRPEWTLNPFIEGNYGDSAGGPHCVWLRGVKTKNGVPYIVIQQSWDDTVGDKGLFYISREAFNKEFLANYGAFTFKKLSKNLAEYYNGNGIQAPTNKFVQFIHQILIFLNIWKQNKI